MAASDDIVFAIAIVKCVLIVSCGLGTIVYLAWAGGKRLFSDEDGSPASHFAEAEKARLQLHADAQHTSMKGIAILQLRR